MPETRHVWISVKQILEGILEARMWLFRTCPVPAVPPPFSSGLCPGVLCSGPLKAPLFPLHWDFSPIGCHLAFRNELSSAFTTSTHLVQLFSRASCIPHSTQRCGMSELGGTLQIINANPALQMRKLRPKKPLDSFKTPGSGPMSPH